MRDIMNETITIGETILVTLFTFVCVIGYVFVKTILETNKNK
jgi:hypothetical protein